MAQVIQALKDLLSVVQVFIDFGGALIMPAKDATSGAYTITLVNAVVWASILFPLASGGASFLLGLIKGRKTRRA